MSLPNRFFYSLPEAAEFLTSRNLKCSVNDLLHFADTGMLEVCTPVSGYWRSTTGTSGLDYRESVFLPHPDFSWHYPFSIPDNYQIDDLELSTRILYISSKKLLDFPDAPDHQAPEAAACRYLYIDGMMALHSLRKSMAFYDFLKQGLAPAANFIYACPRNIGKATDTQTFPKLNFNLVPFSIEFADLFITDSEIRLLMNGGKEFTSDFTGRERTYWLPFLARHSVSRQDIIARGKNVHAFYRDTSNPSVTDLL
ncbi:hypothetical protein [Entomohabitans teleogrylli]|uniref:hypothetical protein n=1 Tax=Entomohabitans teleogrylli TaxID=1384589 RepID=UPI00073D24EC|nr:hypothetical protein [Entomohabitans teleogrylli]